MKLLIQNSNRILIILSDHMTLMANNIMTISIIFISSTTNQKRLKTGFFVDETKTTLKLSLNEIDKDQSFLEFVVSHIFS